MEDMRVVGVRMEGRGLDGDGGFVTTRRQKTRKTALSGIMLVVIFAEDAKVFCKKLQHNLL